jgi:TolA-binding protein
MVAPVAPEEPVAPRRTARRPTHRAPATTKPAPDAGSAPPEPSARDLLLRAQRKRAARDFGGAARIYRKLIQKFPGSAEAQASLVSLGIIQLGPLRNPTGALRLFDRYLRLSRRGALAQEATLGRARALRALGRRQEEVQTLREFLRRYPRALQAPQVKQRLGHLLQPRRVQSPPSRPM